MARSDLLVSLIRAGATGDQRLLRRTVEAIISDERAKQHHVLADTLSEVLNGPAQGRSLAPTDDKLQSLLYEFTPKRTLQDLILFDDVLSECMDLVEEHQRKDLLRSYNLEPRHRVLLVGPPGNGKTSLAEALSHHLMLPMYVVRYEGVVGSFLGETAFRLRRVFDFVRDRNCVLFFDEFETVGKERGDVHETGEIKRVVSSLLLQVDALPSHVVVVTATNHPELLDRAVWRRFQIRLQLNRPGLRERGEWFRRLEGSLKEPLGVPIPTLSKAFEGANFSDLEEFSNDIARAYILRMPDSELKQIVRAKLRSWRRRAGPSRVRSHA